MHSAIGTLTREGRTLYYAYIGAERVYVEHEDPAEIEAYLRADRTPDQRTAVLADAIAKLEANEANIVREASVVAITSTPYIIGFDGLEGLGLKFSPDGRTAQLVGYQFADRFSRWHAELICGVNDLRNGEGKVARPIGYVDAQQAALDATRSTLKMLRELAAEEAAGH